MDTLVDPSHPTLDAAREDVSSAFKFSGQCHQYAPVGTVTPNLASPTFPFEKSEKRPATPAAASSRSYRRRAKTRRGPKSQFSCNICGKVYAQPQGVTRHHREAHQVSKCMYCGVFKWGRPYQFRKHLKEKHPNVDPENMPGRPMTFRRKVTIIPSQSPRQRVSPPTLEHDRRDRAEPHPSLLAPPPSEVAEVTPLSLPVMSSSDYDSFQPEPVVPMNMTRALEELPYSHAAVLPMEEHGQRASDLEMASQSGQNWWVPAFLFTTHVFISDSSTNCSPRCQNEGHSACQGALADCQFNWYHASHPYRLLADIVTAQSSWILWFSRLDPRILGHSPVQSSMRSGVSAP
jgi:hypothetical protein